MTIDFIDLMKTKTFFSLKFSFRASLGAARSVFRKSVIFKVDLVGFAKVKNISDLLLYLDHGY